MHCLSSQVTCKNVIKAAQCAHNVDNIEIANDTEQLIESIRAVFKCIYKAGLKLTTDQILRSNLILGRQDRQLKTSLDRHQSDSRRLFLPIKDEWEEERGSNDDHLQDGWGKSVEESPAIE